MKRLNSIFVPAIATLMAAGLIQLRDWQWEKGFEAQAPLGGASTWLMLGLTAAAVVIWLLLSRSISSGSGFVSERSVAAGLLELLAGLAVAVSSVAGLFGHTQQSDLMAQVADVLGLAAGFCLCVLGGLLLLGRKIPVVLRIVPYVFLMLRLVSDFRGWSIDPILLDYGFRHFGLIFAMCGCYCAATLGFGKGRRRLTAFWAMGGMGFCAMGIVGVELMESLLYMGLTVALLGVLMQVSGRPAETD